MKRLAFGLFVAACSSPASIGPLPDSGVMPSPDTGVELDEVIDVAFDAPSTFEAEPSLAVTPGGSVAAAWIGMGSPSRIGYAISRDRGRTFGATQIAKQSSGDAADPALAVGRNEDLWLAWLSFVDDGVQTTESHIWVSRAGSADETFSDPVDVSANNGTALVDKPSIAVTDGGAAVVAYLRNTGLVAASSKDGTTWKRSTIIDEGGTRVNHLPSLCSSGGRTFVAHVRYGYKMITGPREVMLRWSDDDGQSWPGNNVTQVSTPDETDAVFLDVPCVARNGEVWILYGRTHDSPSGEDFGAAYALRLAHSPDGGKTIDSRIDVHDPSAGQVFLDAHLAGADGTLAVAYYAGTMQGDPNASLRWTRSNDGKTFSPSAVARQPVELEDSRSSTRWIGDYIGLGVARGRLYSAYADNAGSASHIRFHRTRMP